MEDEPRAIYVLYCYECIIMRMNLASNDTFMNVYNLSTKLHQFLHLLFIALDYLVNQSLSILS